MKHDTCDLIEPKERLHIGKYYLTKWYNGNIWIGDGNSGEGGEFNVKELENLIEQFYVENL